MGSAADKDEDRRLARLSVLCGRLPQSARAVRRPCGLSGARQGFAYFLNDHHGDGIVSVCVKTALGENVDRAGREPERFYLPAYIGPRGWVGLRLDRRKIDWQEVDLLLRQSYRLVAAKGLVKTLDARDV